MQHATVARLAGHSDTATTLKLYASVTDDQIEAVRAAYAEAMAAAGVEARLLPCRGQIHTSIVAVDMIVSSSGARAEMGATLRGFFGD